jgi:hypothetical protein
VHYRRYVWSTKHDSIGQCRIHQDFVVTIKHGRPIVPTSAPRKAWIAPGQARPFRSTSSDVVWVRLSVDAVKDLDRMIMTHSLAQDTKVRVRRSVNLLQDPGALRQDGIPAIVRADSFCSSDPIPAGFAQLVSGLAAPYPKGPAPAAASFTINPAAMPAGTELSFGFFLPWNSRIGTIIELIDTNSYTCSRTAPLAPAYGEGYAAEYAQPASP